MYAEERQQAMAQTVTSRGRVSVADLATEFRVTTETVRRDLSQLERLGLVRRVHGGAVPATSLSGLERVLADRDTTHTEEKERIARAALELLPPDGSTVLLDAGTTTARLAALLPHERRFTVVTHSVPAITTLAGLRNVDLHVLPGRVRHTTQAAVGAETVEVLHRLRAEVAFVGTNGISADHGLSTPHHEEAAVKRAMVEGAGQVVALTDASKFEVESAVRFAELEQLHVLVADDKPGDLLADALSSADVQVVVA